MDLLILQRLFIPQRHLKAPKITKVLWKVPLIFFVKANIDGSLIGNSASCGAILCDNLANFLGGVILQYFPYFFPIWKIILKPSSHMENNFKV